jgi:hypothetical protein
MPNSSGSPYIAPTGTGAGLYFSQNTDLFTDSSIVHNTLCNLKTPDTTLHSKVAGLDAHGARSPGIGVAADA